MAFEFFLKLALASFGVGTLLTILGATGNIKDMTITGIVVMCLSVFIGVFAIGEDDEQTRDIKAGLCIAQETEMYQPPSIKSHSGRDVVFEAYPRTRYHCPATEFYRRPQ